MEFVQFFTIKNIPKYLFRQIEGFSEEQINALYENHAAFEANPSNLLFTLIDDENIIKGFLWATVNSLENNLLVVAFTVDKQCQGDWHKKVSEFLLDYIEKNSQGRVKSELVALTSRPKAYERAGWKRHEKVYIKFERAKDETSNDADGDD